MDDKHSHIHTSPLAFALTVSCFLCIALPRSHSQPSPSPSPPLCAEQLYRCNISVSAIFDPPSEKIPPSQCNGADPPSLISCHGGYGAQNFTVKDVDNTNHTMKVMLRPPVNHVCSPHFFFYYENFNNILLLHNAPVHKIIIFEHCPKLPDFPSNRKFTCGDDVYYFEEEHKEREMLDKYRRLRDCNGSLNVPAAGPLDRYDDTDDGAGVLEEALNDAFEVNYSSIPDGCRRCGESDESCSPYGYGYDEHLVSCNYYCPNQYCSPERSVTGSAIAAVLISFSILCVRYKSPTWQANFGLASKSNQNIEAFLKIHGPLALKRYKLSDVKKMTKNFRVKLGQGGFGAVYKGELSNGSFVAVKMLSASKKNGEEFVNEVASISRTSHVNVVSLLGFCLKGRKRALIYEFMSYGSLDKFIYTTRDETLPPLCWNIIYQIARDIARGLEYLHKGCNTRIFHFDIKPHNILLNENFCAKISDFGLAKLCPRNESVISLSDARGTMGYVAPEMWSRNFGRVSHKSDVYSYGMMLLEMVGGRKNINGEASNTSEIYFPHWAYNKIELDNDLRPDIKMTTEENEIAKRLAMVGLWCTQTFPNERPTMSRVIDMLEGSMDSLQIPPKPLLSSPIRS
ncbi:hypothetical protein V8G54_013535 [Vigna mungo]|uniref:Protein kinase domain-containing protein n=1 Tax=Vigna mungo TaxID=3915 RepID=A0AAQ3S1M5_VIGMU